MAKASSKPKMSFLVEHEDKAALDAVVAAVAEVLPALGDSAQAIVQRAAFRIGLRALAKNPVQTATVRITKDEIVKLLERYGAMIRHLKDDPAGQSEAMAFLAPYSDAQPVEDDEDDQKGEPKKKRRGN
jgi:hypothetical protein